MTLLSGKLIADRILVDLKEHIAGSGVRPGLAAILVGDYIESHKYIGLKEERAKEIGIYFEKHLFPATVTTGELLKTIEELNQRADIHGILVQLPLPGNLPADTIIRALDPKKDVDGFHEETLKRFLGGDQEACPVFPMAIVELIRATGFSFQGEQGVAVVNSELLGEIIREALTLEGLVSEYVLSSQGKEVIAKKTRNARVIVTACGVPDLITADMLSPGAIVIDGGNVHVDGKVRGDVDREGALVKEAWLSPVPGGVGPLTIAFLLKKTAEFSFQGR